MGAIFSGEMGAEQAEFPLSITEYDIAAFQPRQQKALEDVTTYQFINSGDGVNSGFWGVVIGSTNEPENGKVTSKRHDGGLHSIWSFTWILGLVNSLPQGQYVWNSTLQKFVPR